MFSLFGLNVEILKCNPPKVQLDLAWERGKSGCLIGGWFNEKNVRRVVWEFLSFLAFGFARSTFQNRNSRFLSYIILEKKDRWFTNCQVSRCFQVRQKPWDPWMIQPGAQIFDDPSATKRGDNASRHTWFCGRTTPSVKTRTSTFWSSSPSWSCLGRYGLSGVSCSTPTAEWTNFGESWRDA